MWKWWWVVLIPGWAIFQVNSTSYGYCWSTFCQHFRSHNPVKDPVETASSCCHQHLTCERNAGVVCTRPKPCIIDSRGDHGSQMANDFVFLSSSIILGFEFDFKDKELDGFIGVGLPQLVCTFRWSVRTISLRIVRAQRNTIRGSSWCTSYSSIVF